ncbi:mitochondrial fission ELM1 family protein [Oleiagrimonas sp. MCCC 1A03011]|uniref:mitochondrial fission ELM1 family protein n=1 Tax=Oleiagrimonas sp. MCCC 1A03011 TaxID=1926883 RepID=UPI000DC55179|nr:mitochondrial fission ELM1 family protein [Oleiagrimonas sp. MCCC 1A03011]RAP56975.1 nucleoside-diphosphate sugar epimerase [Oleiagrimonas sp. MCCC 1A03011]
MLENDTKPVSGTAQRCWVLTDGAAGNERQALALAQALELPARNLVLPLRPPWSWLAPRRLPGGRLAVDAGHRHHLAPPWPDLAIGCGRAAALLTRLLPDLSGGTTRCVQILDPRIDPKHWDAVIAPQHDGLTGPNVLNPLGSLNPIDDAWLASGREAFAHLGELPGPRLGVLLGGPRRGAPLDEAWTNRLVAHLRARRQRDGGSVLLLASRRTPDALFERVRDALEGVPGLQWRNVADGPNPYPGVLGWADRLIVTPDSVNMLSEAAATGAPVHTLVPETLPPKLARFHAALRQRGLLHDLEDEAPTTTAPLRETAAIAAELRRRLGL